MTAALPVVTINGKEFRQNDFVMNQEMTEIEAETINKNPFLTGLKAEIIEVEEPEREQLIKEAKELGIDFPKNISNKKLQEKINEHKQ